MKLKVFTKSKILDLLHNQDIQISNNTIIELDDFVTRLIFEAVQEIKINENVKRINGEMLITYVIKNMKSKQNGSKCQRCTGIKDVFIKAARDLQVMVIDEAKIVLSALEHGENYVK